MSAPSNSQLSQPPEEYSGSYIPQRNEGRVCEYGIRFEQLELYAGQPWLKGYLAVEHVANRVNMAGLRALTTSQSGCLKVAKLLQGDNQTMTTLTHDQPLQFLPKAPLGFVDLRHQSFLPATVLAMDPLAMLKVPQALLCSRLQQLAIALPITALLVTTLLAMPSQAPKTREPTMKSTFVCLTVLDNLEQRLSPAHECLNSMTIEHYWYPWMQLAVVLRAIYNMTTPAIHLMTSPHDPLAATLAVRLIALLQWTTHILRNRAIES
ncbi:hypothetical protein BDV98DRAFT_586487 [Pterulicium gracile]|uniref:Uncharacterized protein n=1 Tax=Pterulicium gracile TaxID=1884261 RepID=A0A5C3Q7D3_9AGAR|nr:hypothetical protein BDV98DRAFT_586487 [Pterula gracilis]